MRLSAAPKRPIGVDSVYPYRIRMMIDWRQQYADPQRDQLLGDWTAIECTDEEDMAVQQFAEEADINVMMKRFGQTGQISTRAEQPVYGDFSEVGDFQSALNAVRQAQADFEALPSALRERFANDPGRLLSFVQDDRNFDEAQRLGLIPTPAPIEPVPVAELPEE